MENVALDRPSMPDSLSCFKVIETHILARAKRRRLMLDLPRTRYAVSRIFSKAQPLENGAASFTVATPPANKAKNALVIGVGHGHDSIVALLDHHVERLVGVDPYFADDGNDDEDYNTLLGMISELEIEKRVCIEKMPILAHLETTRQRYDLIVMNDVLHHIFLTPKRLERSELYQLAVKFAQALSKVATNDCTVVICDVERHGLRQLLYKTGILSSCVNFQTKQNWRSWAKPFQAAGWQVASKQNYVPYDLRRWEGVLASALGTYTACERYIVRMTRQP